MRDAVVAIEIDVEKPERGRAPADAFDFAPPAARQRFAAATDAEQHESVLRVVGFERSGARAARSMRSISSLRSEHPALSRLPFIRFPFSGASAVLDPRELVAVAVEFFAFLRNDARGRLGDELLVAELRSPRSTSPTQARGLLAVALGAGPRGARGADAGERGFERTSPLRRGRARPRRHVGCAGAVRDLRGDVSRERRASSGARGCMPISARRLRIRSTARRSASKAPRPRGRPELRTDRARSPS